VSERLGALDLLFRGGEDAHTETTLQLLVVGDVVAVRMRGQEVGDLDFQTVDRRQQRFDRRARVDEDGRAAGAVRDEVGVRKPAGIHAPFDYHGAGRMPAEHTHTEDEFSWPAS
jgi:hypothetical protein